MLLDGRLRYYLADSETGELEEVAIVKAGPAFHADPRAIVTLGFGLIHEAGYNGQRRRERGQPAIVRDEMPAPELPPAAPPSRRGQSRRRAHSLTVDDLVDYLGEHDGARLSEIMRDLAPELPPKTRNQLIGNRIRAYFERCKRRGERPAIRQVTDGGVSRLYLAH